MVPTPDSSTPTDEHSSENLAPGFWNEPEDEHVVKPALRGHCHQEQKACVALPPTKQSQSKEWARHNQQRYEALVQMKMAHPQQRPSGHDYKSERHKYSAGDQAPSRRRRERDGQTQLRLC